MPITYKTFKELFNIGINQLKTNIPTINTTIKNSWAVTFHKSMAAMSNALNLTIRDSVGQKFAQTAQGEFLVARGEELGITKPPATYSVGNINIGGTLTTLIPQDTEFQSVDGYLYTSQSDAIISTYDFDIQTISRTNDLATVTTDGEHTFSSGLDVDITGTTGFDGTYEITIISNTQFTFVYTGVTTATSIGGLAEADYANISIQANETGTDYNLSGSNEFSFTGTIPSGADSSGFSQILGMYGGASLATDDEYRALIILDQSTVKGNFTNTTIEQDIKSISGNTRVWIKNPLAGNPGGYLEPKINQVSAFFVRDNDEPITPSQSIIDDAKQKILDRGIPADVNEDDIFVNTPILNVINFSFSFIQPDTTLMRQAIITNLQAFFDDNVNFEQVIIDDAYRGAIINTIDSTGQILLSFAISSPSGDIGGSVGTIVTLGDVTF